MAGKLCLVYDDFCGIHRVNFEVRTLRDASRVFRVFVTANNLGDRNIISAEVTTATNCKYDVSYNGRVWYRKATVEVVGDDLDSLL